MRTPKIFASALMILVLGTGAAVLGGTQEKKTPETERAAKPGPEMEKLKFLLGTWTYTETYEKTPLFPNGGQNTGTYISKLGPGGFSIVNDFHSVGPVGDFQGLDIITWEPAAQSYKSYIFPANGPGVFIRTGRWEGETLVFTLSFEGESPVALRSVTRQTGKDTAEIHEYYSMGGKPEQLMLTVKAKRN
jgi:hypothetical protein